MANYYEILEVERRATGKDIRKAYKALCERYHPDKNPGVAGITDKFQDIQKAYETLSNTEKRRRYDKTLDVPPGAAIVMMPPPSQTPAGEERRVVVCQAVSLEETLAQANLNSDALLKLALENKALAKEILKRKCLEPYYLAQLGSAYEELAIEILSQSAYWELLKISIAILHLATAYASACQLILNNPALSQALNGKHLHKLVVKHGSTCLAIIQAQEPLRIKYQAYQTLIAWKTGQTKTATVEQLCLAIQASAIHDDDLNKIARLNSNVAKAVVKSKRLKHFNLAYVGSAYEEVAIEILSQADYWQLLEFNCVILHLAEAYVSACRLILNNPALSQKLNGKDLHELVVKHGQPALATIQAQEPLRIQYQAYQTLIAWKTGQTKTATVEQLCLAIQASAIDHGDLNEIARLNSNVAMAVVKSKRLKHFNLAYVGSAYEEVAIEILSQADYWKLLNSDLAIFTLAETYANACRLTLLNAELAHKLSGEHLAQLIQKYPKAATEVIVQDRILLERLQSYELLHGALKRGVAKLQDSYQGECLDASEALFQQGLAYQSQGSLQYLILAGKCYLDAARQGNKSALDAFIALLPKISDKNDAKALAQQQAAIADIYADEDNPLSDKDQANKWYHDAAKNDPKHAVKLIFYIRDRVGNANYGENLDDLLKVFIGDSDRQLIERQIVKMQATQGNDLKNQLQDMLNELVRDIALMFENALYPKGEFEFLRRATNLNAGDYYKLGMLCLEVAVKEQEALIKRANSHNSIKDRSYKSERIGKALRFLIKSVTLSENEYLSLTLSILREWLATNMLDGELCRLLLDHAIISKELNEKELAALQAQVDANKKIVQQQLTRDAAIVTASNELASNKSFPYLAMLGTLMAMAVCSLACTLWVLFPPLGAATITTLALYVGSKTLLTIAAGMCGAVLGLALSGIAYAFSNGVMSKPNLTEVAPIVEHRQTHPKEKVGVSVFKGYGKMPGSEYHQGKKEIGTSINKEERMRVPQLQV